MLKHTVLSLMFTQGFTLLNTFLDTSCHVALVTPAIKFVVALVTFVEYIDGDFTTLCS